MPLLTRAFATEILVRFVPPRPAAAKLDDEWYAWLNEGECVVVGEEEEAAEEENNGVCGCVEDAPVAWLLLLLLLASKGAEYSSWRRLRLLSGESDNVLIFWDKPKGFEGRIVSSHPNELCDQVILYY